MRFRLSLIASIMILSSIVALKDNKASDKISPKIIDPESFITNVFKCYEKSQKFVPFRIVYTIAAIESAYGTSNIAIKTNNLFGLKNTQQGYDYGGDLFISVYNNICDSVNDFQHYVATSNYMSNYRLSNASEYDKLVYFNNYSENPNYVHIIQQFYSKLTDTDKYQ